MFEIFNMNMGKIQSTAISEFDKKWNEKFQPLMQLHRFPWGDWNVSFDIAIEKGYVL